MNIETVRQFCLSLPSVSEEIKWDDDLCFSVAGKLFCVCGLEGQGTAFKVADEEFDELCAREGIAAAPYFGRFKWVKVGDFHAFTDDEWRRYIKQSYDLNVAKLPKKVRDNL